MPKVAAFFLFAALASMGLPMLNGFVGEYLVLLGTYQSHWAWASWAALGVILSACYLLWSYQRVFFGEVTREKNKTLADASAREKFILVTLSIVMLWMGIGSTYFTRRTAAASQAVIDQVEPQRPYEAGVPAGAGSGVQAGAQKDVQAILGKTNNLRDAKEIPAAEGANR